MEKNFNNNNPEKYRDYSFKNEKGESVQLTEDQIQDIISYKNEYGDLMSQFEFQNFEHFDDNLRSFSNYFTYGPSKKPQIKDEEPLTIEPPTIPEETPTQTIPQLEDPIVQPTPQQPVQQPKKQEPLKLDEELDYTNPVKGKKITTVLAAMTGTTQEQAEKRGYNLNFLPFEESWEQDQPLIDEYNKAIEGTDQPIITKEEYAKVYNNEYYRIKGTRDLFGIDANHSGIDPITLAQSQGSFGAKMQIPIPSNIAGLPSEAYEQSQIKFNPESYENILSQYPSGKNALTSEEWAEKANIYIDESIPLMPGVDRRRNLAPVQFTDNFGNRYVYNDDGEMQILALKRTAESNYRPMWHAVPADEHAISSTIRSIYGPKGKNSTAWQDFSNSFWNGTIDQVAGKFGTAAEYLGSWSDYVFGKEGEKGALTRWGIETQNWSHVSKSKMSEEADRQSISDFTMRGFAKTSGEVLPQILSMILTAAIAGPGAARFTGSLDAMHYFNTEAADAGIPDEDRLNLALVAGIITYGSEIILGKMGGDEIIANLVRKPNVQKAAQQKFREYVGDVMVRVGKMDPNLTQQAKKRKMAGMITGMWQKIFKESNLDRKIAIPKKSNASVFSKGKNSLLRYVIPAAVEEGTEEVIDYAGQTVLKEFYDTFLANQFAVPGHGKFGAEFSTQEMWESFLAGAVGGAYGGVIGGAFNRQVELTDNAIADLAATNSLEENMKFLDKLKAEGAFGNPFFNEDGELLELSDDKKSQNDIRYEALRQNLLLAHDAKAILNSKYDDAESRAKALGGDDALASEAISLIRKSDEFNVAYNQIQSKLQDENISDQNKQLLEANLKDIEQRLKTVNNRLDYITSGQLHAEYKLSLLVNPLIKASDFKTKASYIEAIEKANNDQNTDNRSVAYQRVRELVDAKNKTNEKRAAIQKEQQSFNESIAKTFEDKELQSLITKFDETTNIDDAKDLQDQIKAYLVNNDINIYEGSTLDNSLNQKANTFKSELNQEIDRNKLTNSTENIQEDLLTKEKTTKELSDYFDSKKDEILKGYKSNLKDKQVKDVDSLPKSLLKDFLLMTSEILKDRDINLEVLSNEASFNSFYSDVLEQFKQEFNSFETVEMPENLKVSDLDPNLAEDAKSKEQHYYETLTTTEYNKQEVSFDDLLEVLENKIQSQTVTDEDLDKVRSIKFDLIGKIDAFTQATYLKQTLDGLADMKGFEEVLQSDVAETMGVNEYDVFDDNDLTNTLRLYAFTFDVLQKRISESLIDLDSKFKKENIEQAKMQSDILTKIGTTTDTNGKRIFDQSVSINIKDADGKEISKTIKLSDFEALLDPDATYENVDELIKRNADIALFETLLFELSMTDNGFKMLQDVLGVIADTEYKTITKLVNEDKVLGVRLRDSLNKFHFNKDELTYDNFKKPTIERNVRTLYYNNYLKQIFKASKLDVYNLVKKHLDENPDRKGALTPEQEFSLFSNLSQTLYSNLTKTQKERIDKNIELINGMIPYDYYFPPTQGNMSRDDYMRIANLEKTVKINPGNAGTGKTYSISYLLSSEFKVNDKNRNYVIVSQSTDQVNNLKDTTQSVLKSSSKQHDNIRYLTFDQFFSQTDYFNADGTSKDVKNTTFIIDEFSLIKYENKESIVSLAAINDTNSLFLYGDEQQMPNIGIQDPNISAKITSIPLSFTFMPNVRLAQIMRSGYKSHAEVQTFFRSADLGGSNILNNQTYYYSKNGLNKGTRIFADFQELEEHAISNIDNDNVLLITINEDQKSDIVEKYNISEENAEKIKSISDYDNGPQGNEWNEVYVLINQDDAYSQEYINKTRKYINKAFLTSTSRVKDYLAFYLPNVSSDRVSSINSTKYSKPVENVDDLEMFNLSDEFFKSQKEMQDKKYAAIAERLASYTSNKGRTKAEVLNKPKPNKKKKATGQNKNTGKGNKNPDDNNDDNENTVPEKPTQNTTLEVAYDKDGFEYAKGDIVFYNNKQYQIVDIESLVKTNDFILTLHDLSQSLSPASTIRIDPNDLQVESTEEINQTKEAQTTYTAANPRVDGKLITENIARLQDVPLFNNQYVYSDIDTFEQQDAKEYFAYKTLLAKRVMDYVKSKGVSLNKNNSYYIVEDKETLVGGLQKGTNTFLNLYITGEFHDSLLTEYYDLAELYSNLSDSVATSEDSLIVGSFNATHFASADTNYAQYANELLDSDVEKDAKIENHDILIEFDTKNFHISYKERGKGRSLFDLIDYVRKSGGAIKETSVTQGHRQVVFNQKNITVKGQKQKPSVETFVEITLDGNIKDENKRSYASVEIIPPLIHDIKDEFKSKKNISFDAFMQQQELDFVEQFFNYNRKAIEAGKSSDTSTVLFNIKYDQNGKLVLPADKKDHKSYKATILDAAIRYMVENSGNFEIRLNTLKTDNSVYFPYDFIHDMYDRVKTNVDLLSPRIQAFKFKGKHRTVEFVDDVDVEEFFPEGETIETVNALAEKFIPGYIKNVGGIDFHSPIKLSQSSAALGYTKGTKIGVAALADGRASVSSFFHELGHFVKDNLLSTEAAQILEQEVQQKFPDEVADEKIQELLAEYMTERNNLSGFSAIFRSILDWIANVINNLKGYIGLKSELEAYFYYTYKRKHIDALNAFYDDIDSLQDEDAPIKYASVNLSGALGKFHNILGEYKNSFFRVMSKQMYDNFVSPKKGLDNFITDRSTTDIVESVDDIEYSFREKVLQEFVALEFDKATQDDTYVPKIKMLDDKNPNLISLNQVDALEFYDVSKDEYVIIQKSDKGRFFSDTNTNRKNNRELLSRKMGKYVVSIQGQNYTFKNIIDESNRGNKIIDRMNKSELDLFISYLLMNDSYFFANIKSFFPNINLGNPKTKSSGLFYDDKYGSVEQSIEYLNTSIVDSTQQYKENEETDYTDKQSTITKLVLANIPKMVFSFDNNNVAQSSLRQLNTYFLNESTPITEEVEVPQNLNSKTLNNLLLTFYKDNVDNFYATQFGRTDDILKFSNALESYLRDNNVIDKNGNLNIEGAADINSNENLQYIYSFYNELFNYNKVSHFSLYQLFESLRNGLEQSDLTQPGSYDAVLNRIYGFYLTMNPETIVPKENFAEYLRQSHKFAANILSSVLLTVKNTEKKNLLKSQHGKKGTFVKKINSNSQVAFAEDMKEKMDQFIYSNNLLNPIATRFLLFQTNPFVKLTEQELKDEKNSKYVGKPDSKSDFIFNNSVIQYKGEIFARFNDRNQIEFDTANTKIDYNKLIIDYLKYIGIGKKQISIKPIAKQLTSSETDNSGTTNLYNTLNFVATNLMASHILAVQEFNLTSGQLGISNIITHKEKYEKVLKEHLRIDSDSMYGQQYIDDTDVLSFDPKSLDTQIDFIANALQKSYGGIFKEHATIANKKIYLNQTRRAIDTMMQTIKRKISQTPNIAAFIANNPLFKISQEIANPIDLYDFQIAESFVTRSDRVSKKMTESEHFFVSVQNYFGNFKNTSTARNKRNLIPLFNAADRTPVFADVNLKIYTKPNERKNSNGFLVSIALEDGTKQYFLDNQNILGLTLDQMNIKNSLQVNSINRWNTVLGLPLIEDQDMRSITSLDQFRQYTKSVDNAVKKIQAELNNRVNDQIDDLLAKDTDITLQPGIDYVFYTTQKGTKKIFAGFDTTNFKRIDIKEDDRFIQSPVNLNGNQLKNKLFVLPSKWQNTTSAQKNAINKLNLRLEDAVFLLSNITQENMLQQEKDALSLIIGDLNSAFDMQDFVINNVFKSYLQDFHEKAKSNNFKMSAEIPNISKDSNFAGIIADKKFNVGMASYAISYDMSNFMMHHVQKGSYANFASTSYDYDNFVNLLSSKINNRSKINTSPGMSTIKNYYGEDKALRILTFKDVDLQLQSYNNRTKENENTTQNGTDGYTLINPLQQRMLYQGLSGQAGVTPLSGTFKTVGEDLNFETGVYITQKHNEFTLSYDFLDYAPENETLLQIMLNPDNVEDNLYTAYKNIFDDQVRQGVEPSIAFENAMDMTYNIYISNRDRYNIVHKITRESSRKEESQHKTISFADYQALDQADKSKYVQEIDSDNFRFVLNQDDVQGNYKQQDFIQILRIFLASNNDEVTNNLVGRIKNLYDEIFKIEFKSLSKYFKNKLGKNPSIAEIHNELHALERENDLHRYSNNRGMQSMVTAIAERGIQSTSNNSLLATLISENPNGGNDISGVRTRVVQYLKAKIRKSLIKHERSGMRNTTRPGYNIKIYEFNEVDELGNVKTKYFSKSEAERHNQFMFNSLSLDENNTVTLTTQEELDNYHRNRESFAGKFIIKELDHTRYLDDSLVESQILTKPTYYKQYGIPDNIRLNDIQYLYKSKDNKVELVDFTEMVDNPAELKSEITSILNNLYEIADVSEIVDGKLVGKLQIVPKEGATFAINNPYWSNITLQLQNYISSQLNTELANVNVSAKNRDQVIESFVEEKKSDAIDTISEKVKDAIIAIVKSTNALQVRTPSGPGSGTPSKIIGFTRLSGDVVTSNPKDFKITGEDADGDEKSIYMPSITKSMLGKERSRRTIQDIQNDILETIKEIQKLPQNKDLFSSISGVDDFKVKTKKNFVPLNVGSNSQQYEDSHKGKGDVGVYASIQKQNTTMISAQNDHKDAKLINDFIDQGEDGILNISTDMNLDSNATLQNRESITNIVLDLIKHSDVDILFDLESNVFLSTIINYQTLIEKHFRDTGRPIQVLEGDKEPVYVKAIKRLTNTAAFKAVVEKIKEDKFFHKTSRPKTIAQQALTFFENNNKYSDEIARSTNTNNIELRNALNDAESYVDRFLEGTKDSKILNILNKAKTKFNEFKELDTVPFQEALDLKKSLLRLEVNMQESEDTDVTTEIYKEEIKRAFNSVLGSILQLNKNRLRSNANFNRDLFFIAKLALISEINTDFSRVTDINQYKFTSNSDLINYIDNLEKLTGFKFEDILTTITQYEAEKAANPNLKLSEFFNTNATYIKGKQGQIEMFRDKYKNRMNQNFYNYLSEKYERPSYKIGDQPAVASETIVFENMYYEVYNAMGVILGDSILRSQIKAVALDKSIESSIHIVTTPVVRKMIDKLKDYAGIDSLSATKFNNIKRQFQKYFMGLAVMNRGNQIVKDASSFLTSMTLGNIGAKELQNGDFSFDKFTVAGGRQIDISLKNVYEIKTFTALFPKYFKEKIMPLLNVLNQGIHMNNSFLNELEITQNNNMDYLTINNSINDNKKGLLKEQYKLLPEPIQQLIGLYVLTSNQRGAIQDIISSQGVRQVIDYFENLKFNNQQLYSKDSLDQFEDVLMQVLASDTQYVKTQSKFKDAEGKVKRVPASSYYGYAKYYRGPINTSVTQSGRTFIDQQFAFFISEGDSFGHSKSGAGIQVYNDYKLDKKNKFSALSPYISGSDIEGVSKNAKFQYLNKGHIITHLAIGDFTGLEILQYLKTSNLLGDNTKIVSTFLESFDLPDSPLPQPLTDTQIEKIKNRIQDKELNKQSFKYNTKLHNSEYAISKGFIKQTPDGPVKDSDRLKKMIAKDFKDMMYQIIMENQALFLEALASNVKMFVDTSQMQTINPAYYLSFFANKFNSLVDKYQIDGTAASVEKAFKELNKSLSQEVNEENESLLEQRFDHGVTQRAIINIFGNGGLPFSKDINETLIDHNFDLKKHIQRKIIELAYAENVTTIIKDVEGFYKHIQDSSQKYLTSKYIDKKPVDKDSYIKLLKEYSTPKEKTKFAKFINRLLESTDISGKKLVNEDNDFIVNKQYRVPYTNSETIAQNLNAFETGEKAAIKISKKIDYEIGDILYFQDGFVGNVFNYDKRSGVLTYNILKSNIKQHNVLSAKIKLDNVIHDSNNKNSVLEITRSLKQAFPNLNVNVIDNEIANDIGRTEDLSFVMDGEIYINIDKATKGVAIHEFGHPLVAILEQDNIDLFNQLVIQLKGTPLAREVESTYAQEAYNNTNSAQEFERYINHEIIVNFLQNIVDNGQYQKPKRTFFGWLKDFFRRFFGLPAQSNIDKLDLSNSSAHDIGNALIADLLSGNSISNMTSEQLSKMLPSYMPSKKATQFDVTNLDYITISEEFDNTERNLSLKIENQINSSVKNKEVFIGASGTYDLRPEATVPGLGTKAFYTKGKYDENKRQKKIQDVVKEELKASKVVDQKFHSFLNQYKFINSQNSDVFDTAQKTFMPFLKRFKKEEDKREYRLGIERNLLDKLNFNRFTDEAILLDGSAKQNALLEKLGIKYNDIKGFIDTNNKPIIIVSNYYSRSSSVFNPTSKKKIRIYNVTNGNINNKNRIQTANGAVVDGRSKFGSNILTPQELQNNDIVTTYSSIQSVKNTLLALAIKRGDKSIMIDTVGAIQIGHKVKVHQRFIKDLLPQINRVLKHKNIYESLSEDLKNLLADSINTLDNFQLDPVEIIQYLLDNYEVDGTVNKNANKYHSKTYTDIHELIKQESDVNDGSLKTKILNVINKRMQYIKFGNPDRYTFDDEYYALGNIYMQISRGKVNPNQEVQEMQKVGYTSKTYTFTETMDRVDEEVKSFLVNEINAASLRSSMELEKLVSGVNEQVIKLNAASGNVLSRGLEKTKDLFENLFIYEEVVNRKTGKKSRINTYNIHWDINNPLTKRALTRGEVTLAQVQFGNFITTQIEKEFINYEYTMNYNAFRLKIENYDSLPVDELNAQIFELAKEAVDSKWKKGMMPVVTRQASEAFSQGEIASSAKLFFDNVNKVESPYEIYYEDSDNTTDRVITSHFYNQFSKNFIDDYGSIARKEKLGLSTSNNSNDVILIDEQKQKDLSYNLQIVTNYVLASSVRSRNYKDAVTAYHLAQDQYMYLQNKRGIDAKNLLQQIENYAEKTIFGRLPEFDKIKLGAKISVDLNKFAFGTSQVISSVALAMSPILAAKNVAAAGVKGLANAAALQFSGMDFFDIKSFTAAIQEVVSNPEKVTALNKKYVFATMSERELLNSFLHNKTKSNLADTDTQFFMYAYGDKYMNLISSVAQMMYDGTYEAHDQNGNYDYRKDKRFRAKYDSNGNIKGYDDRITNEGLLLINSIKNRNTFRNMFGQSADMDLQAAYTDQDIARMQAVNQRYVTEITDTKFKNQISTFGVTRMIMTLRNYLNAWGMMWFKPPGYESVMGQTVVRNNETVWDPLFNEGIAYSLVNTIKLVKKHGIDGFKQLRPAQRKNLIKLASHVALYAALNSMINAFGLGEEDRELDKEFDDGTFDMIEDGISYIIAKITAGANDELWGQVNPLEIFKLVYTEDQRSLIPLVGYMQSIQKQLLTTSQLISVVAMNPAAREEWRYTLEDSDFKELFSNDITILESIRKWIKNSGSIVPIAGSALRDVNQFFDSFLNKIVEEAEKEYLLTDEGIEYKATKRKIKKQKALKKKEYRKDYLLKRYQFRNMPESYQGELEKLQNEIEQGQQRIQQLEQEVDATGSQGGFSDMDMDLPN